MISETQAVKRVVAALKGKGPHNAGGIASIVWGAEKLIAGDAPPPYWSVNGRWVRSGYWTDRVSRKAFKRLKKRISKKLGQPFRRKKRGPLRRRAAGKNNVRPSR